MSDDRTVALVYKLVMRFSMELSWVGRRCDKKTWTRKRETTSVDRNRNFPPPLGLEGSSPNHMAPWSEPKGVLSGLSD